MATVRAEAKYLPISAQKLRLVCDQVRGLNAEQALVVLQFVPKKGAKFVHKLLSSALANAENNQELARDEMTIATIMVGGGPMLKRYKAGARGRYKARLRRTSHLTIVLSDGGENK